MKKRFSTKCSGSYKDKLKVAEGITKIFKIGDLVRISENSVDYGQFIFLGTRYTEFYLYSENGLEWVLICGQNLIIKEFQ